MRTLLSIILSFILIFFSTNLHSTESCLNTCTDGIMNGQETGIDCGGPDCPPCHCTDNRLHLDDYITNDDFVRSANEWILLDEDVMLQSNSNIIFKAAECINIDKNFEIELGSETLLTIEDCIEPDPYPSSDANLFFINDCGVETEQCTTQRNVCGILTHTFQLNPNGVTLNAFFHINLSKSFLI